MKPTSVMKNLGTGFLDLEMKRIYKEPESEQMKNKTLYKQTDMIKPSSLKQNDMVKSNAKQQTDMI